MKWLDCLRLGRSLCGIALLLSIALLDSATAASVSRPQEMRPAAASTMTHESLPIASDCVPCAICFVAPTPTTHGFSGDCKESESPAWWTQDPQTPASVRYVDSGAIRCAVPIRIAYCRWLD